jgi:hypothetical protein
VKPDEDRPLTAESIAEALSASYGSTQYGASYWAHANIAAILAACPEGTTLRDLLIAARNPPFPPQEDTHRE